MDWAVTKRRDRGDPLCVIRCAKELNEDLGGMRQAALFLLDTGSIYGSKHEVVVDIGTGDEALKRMTYRQQAEGKKVFATGEEILQLRTMWARKSSHENGEGE